MDAGIQTTDRSRRRAGGPLATVIQDLLSILIYFGIAYAIH